MVLRKHKWVCSEKHGSGEQKQENARGQKPSEAKRGGFLFRTLKNYLTFLSVGATVVLWIRRKAGAVNARTASAADVRAMLPRADGCTSPELQQVSSSTHGVAGQGCAASFHVTSRILSSY